MSEIPKKIKDGFYNYEVNTSLHDDLMIDISHQTRKSSHVSTLLQCFILIK